MPDPGCVRGSRSMFCSRSGKIFIRMGRTLRQRQIYMEAAAFVLFAFYLDIPFEQKHQFTGDGHRL